MLFMLPVKKDIDAEGKLLFRSLIQYFSMLKHIVTDRQSLFTSELSGTKRRLSTAYHHQADCQTERQISLWNITCELMLN
jgi:hypothetical protein